MGFNILEQGSPEQVQQALESAEPQEYSNEREENVAATVTQALVALANAIGGTVSVNASGHLAPIPEVGDTVEIYCIAAPGEGTTPEGEGEVEPESEGGGEEQPLPEEGPVGTEQALQSGIRNPNPGGTIVPIPGSGEYESPGNSSGVPGLETVDPNVPKTVAQPTGEVVDAAPDVVPPAEVPPVAANPFAVEPEPEQTTPPATPVQESVITQEPAEPAPEITTPPASGSPSA